MKPLRSPDALLVTNPTNIRYLTGFTGEGRLVVDGDKKYLLTDSRYTEEAKKIPGLTLIKSLDRFKKLEFEEDGLTVAQFKMLSKAKSRSAGKLVPTSGKIEALREVKRKDEIELLRLACKVTKECFRFVEKRIRPGMTESRLAWDIEGYLKFKAGDTAFSPIVAFGDHASRPHYSERSNFPLRKNSLVQLDFGARVRGYCADMSRVLFVDTPKPEWKRAYDAVNTAQKKVFELLNAGERSGATLDRAAKKIISDAGFPPYQHGLGHGVGLEIHENPRLSVKKDFILKPGMVFTVEPATYVEGQYGIRIEDTVLLKEKGIEVLT